MRVARQRGYDYGVIDYNWNGEHTGINPQKAWAKIPWHVTRHGEELANEWLTEFYAGYAEHRGEWCHSE